MAKVSLVVHDFGRNTTQTVSAIRRHTSLPISEVSARIRDREPVFEVRMWERDVRDKVEVLRSLVEQLLALGASFEMFELMNDQSPKTVDSERLIRVDLPKLNNLLLAHERQARQRHD